MTSRRLPYVVDPDDPRAPPHDVWLQMTEAERRDVVAALPSEFEASEAYPPEGEFHDDAQLVVRETLRTHFSRIGRRIYVAGGMAVYYPGERMFSPDIFAVLDVESHKRRSWIVDAEGKGLDLALEVHDAGSLAKDIRTNVQRYARLAIKEYFIFDLERMRLLGHRLTDGGRSYQPIIPQLGSLHSEVLDLEMRIESGRLRFVTGAANLLFPDEILAALESNLREALERKEEEQRQREEEQRLREEEQRLREEEQRLREEEQRRREEEQRRREEEQRLREEAERALASANAEIERLRAELEKLRGK